MKRKFIVRGIVSKEVHSVIYASDAVEAMDIFDDGGVDEDIEGDTIDREAIDVEDEHGDHTHPN